MCFLFFFLNISTNDASGQDSPLYRSCRNTFYGTPSTYVPGVVVDHLRPCNTQYLCPWGGSGSLETLRPQSLRQPASKKI